MDHPHDPRLERLEPQRDRQREARLRVSDADRDQAAAELGEHYQAGRLDAEEFDERLAAALGARTRGDLDKLLEDLPAARRPDPPLPSGHAVSGPGLRPLIALLPLLLVLAFAAAGGGQHGGGGPWPLVWVWWMVIAGVMFRLWHRRPHGSGDGGR